MKNVLLFMLLLTVIVTANAEVFVYTMTEKEVSFTEDSPQWSAEKENIKGYFVVEGPLDYDPNNCVGDVWFIPTFKEGGLKYVGAAQLGAIPVFTAKIGNKKNIIITDSYYHKLFLTGQVTPNAIVIGSKKWSAPVKFTGIAIWNDNETPGEGDIGSAQISLTLHKKYTVYAIEHVLDGTGAKDYIMDILKEQGYEEMTP